MCFKFLLSLKRRRSCLGVLALFLIVSFIAFVGYLYFRSTYNGNIKKIAKIKTREDFFRSHSSEEDYKVKLETTILEVEELESKQKQLHGIYVSCCVISIIFLIMAFLVIVNRLALIYYPSFENCLLMCTTKECSPCKKPECCSGSDEEDTVRQIARDVSASFDRTAQESIVFRGTRNTEGGAGQEASANLPGVPSTSNN